MVPSAFFFFYHIIITFFDTFLTVYFVHNHTAPRSLGRFLSCFRSSNPSAIQKSMVIFAILIYHYHFLFFVFTEGEVPLVTVSVIIYFRKGKCERGYFVFVLVFYLLLGVLHGGRHLMQAAPLNSHESTPTAYLFCVKTLVTQTFRAVPGGISPTTAIRKGRSETMTSRM